MLCESVEDVVGEPPFLLTVYDASFKFMLGRHKKVKDKFHPITCHEGTELVVGG
jgi:hypothetical protein